MVVASNMLHPPFSSWDEEGKPLGVEVDIVKSAAKEMGLEIKFIEKSFSELFDAVESGDVDLAVSTIGVTEERRRKVDFSDSYFGTTIVALVEPASKFRSLQDLEMAVIGADRSTTSYLAARKQFPEAKFVSVVESNSTWPVMLKAGKIDAFVVDASDQNRLESISGIPLRLIDESIATEEFCVAVQKGNQPLMDAVNRAVAKYRETVPYRIGNVYQLTTGLGRRLYSLKNPPEKIVENYIAAKRAYKDNQQNADAIIWYGRRAGYLLRMQEAIDIFSEGISKFPNDPRMYRHRGHRYISIRQFDAAIADLEMAAQLIVGQPDQVEPDGIPNSENIPLTTLHGNIWYHLGLAYYLKNDLKNALRCYNQRMTLEKYGDNVVSNAHWKFMTLRRMGRDDDAMKVVQNIAGDLKVIENGSYHKMCLLYNGKISLGDLNSTTDGTSSADVMSYGIGNWSLYQLNDKNAAKRIFEALFRAGSPYSFAFIAAEADYQRLFSVIDDTAK